MKRQHPRYITIRDGATAMVTSTKLFFDTYNKNENAFLIYMHTKKDLAGCNAISNIDIYENLYRYKR